MTVYGRIQQSICVLGLLLLMSLSTARGLSAAEVELSKGQTIYVPVYSHIYSGDREYPFYLAVTLSIRNTDQDHSISIDSVNYYGSDGNLIRNFLDKPIQLTALASTRYVIKESDKSGGSGANFIVKWHSEKSVNAPILESVMIGTSSQQGISFVSRGQVIKSDKK